MTSQEMIKHDPLKPGYWFVNVSPLGENPDWQIQVMPADSGLLFGYEPRLLLAKQYR